MLKGVTPREQEGWVWWGAEYGGVLTTQSAAEIKYTQGCHSKKTGRMDMREC